MTNSDEEDSLLDIEISYNFINGGDVSMELVEDSKVTAVSYTMLGEQVIKIKKYIEGQAVLRI
jgi:hypothetical protein